MTRALKAHGGRRTVTDTKKDGIASWSAQKR